MGAQGGTEGQAGGGPTSPGPPEGSPQAPVTTATLALAEGLYLTRAVGGWKIFIPCQIQGFTPQNQSWLCLLLCSSFQPSKSPQFRPGLFFVPHHSPQAQWSNRMCLFSWQKQAWESTGVQIHNNKIREKIGIERARRFLLGCCLGRNKFS